MNFLGIFKTVVKDVGVVAKVSAFGVGLYNPALGVIMNKIGTAMVQAEAQIPDDNQGAVKAAAVAQNFSNDMELTRALLAEAGNTMTWDDGLLKTAIDTQAKAFNAHLAFATSIKIAETGQVPAKAVISGQ